MFIDLNIHSFLQDHPLLKRNPKWIRKWILRSEYIRLGISLFLYIHYFSMVSGLWIDSANIYVTVLKVFSGIQACQCWSENQCFSVLLLLYHQSVKLVSATCCHSPHQLWRWRSMKHWYGWLSDWFLTHLFAVKASNLTQCTALHFMTIFILFQNNLNFMGSVKYLFQRIFYHHPITHFWAALYKYPYSILTPAPLLFSIITSSKSQCGEDFF
jgi:hypothetical protein